MKVRILSVLTRIMVMVRGGATCYRHPTCSRELSSA